MLNLCSIAAHWVDCLESSTALNEFCQDRFGKEPNLLEGVDPVDPPTEDDAPWIAVVPAGTEGGTLEEETNLKLFVNVGAVVQDAVQRTGRRLKYTGYSLVEEELCPIILDALEASDHEPADFDLTIVMLGAGYFQAELIITVTEPNTLGR